MVKLFAIPGNSLKLDGGAMFGHVPKALWSTWLAADELNRIRIKCRSLLVKDDDKNILFDVGTGAFFNPELKKRYDIEDGHVLLNSLDAVGFGHEDIDFVVLSHLHFDHIGGLLSGWEENNLLFPKAKFLVSEKAWQRANNPHVRDKNSFTPEINSLLAKSGRLRIVNDTGLLGNNYHFHFSDGHTPGLISTEINTENGIIIFTSDLIIGTHWVHLPIAPGYDRSPEIAINEKEKLLQYAVKNKVKLFYFHDNKTAISEVKRDENGRFYADNVQGEIL
jgi:glyoxylase-like metal-dependent hydrolase (beta-lactamase superfamily II)